MAMDQLKRVKRQWDTNQLILFCETDGGLKDGVVTSGYNISLGSIDNWVIHGHAAEEQEDSWASSTHQEILAQIAVEYWINHLRKIFRIYDNTIHEEIIRDSSVIIQIAKAYNTP